MASVVTLSEQYLFLSPYKFNQNLVFWLKLFSDHFSVC